MEIISEDLLWNRHCFYLHTSRVVRRISKILYWFGLLRRSWDTDWSSRTFLGNWSWETQGWEWVKQDLKAIHGSLRQLPLGTTGTQPCWGVLGDSVDHASGSPTCWRRELGYLSIIGHLHSVIDSISNVFVSNIFSVNVKGKGQG